MDAQYLRAVICRMVATASSLVAGTISLRLYGQYLTPELYGAAIDEAHKHNLRAIAHVFDLEDAKGLLRAGIEGFTHLVRDKEVDEEFLQLLNSRRAEYVVAGATLKRT